MEKIRTGVHATGLRTASRRQLVTSSGHRANLEQLKEVELHALRTGHCDSTCDLAVQFYAEMRMTSHVTAINVS